MRSTGLRTKSDGFYQTSLLHFDEWQLCSVFGEGARKADNLKFLMATKWKNFNEKDEKANKR